MRKLVLVLCVAAVSATGAALAIAPAGAAPAPTKSKVCKTLSGITIEPSSDPTGAGGRENAKKYSKALSKAAKQSKGDIKATLRTLAGYYASIAKGDTSVITANAQEFAAASAKYVNYTVTNCISENLPSGVTIPKIPGQ
ncbi:MAG TPA: hypothetical protein VKE97_11665 [Acidimicrobiia bacterium]|nr:hypothetical protein [Acidimicrobiia bacterium]